MLGAGEELDAGLDLQARAVDEQGDEIVGPARGELAQGVQLAEQGLALAGDDRGEGISAGPRRGRQLEVEVVAVAGVGR